MTIRRFRLTVILVALALVAAACGSGADQEDDGDAPEAGEETTQAEDGEATEGDDEPTGGTMRFVFSPDPVWNWLEEQGIISEMESESGITIDRRESEDEFAFFAGGHADIVSTGSYETPVLEAETGVETVTIGKYNKAKDILVVAADSGYETLGDLPEGEGCRVGVESFSGSTLVWIALAEVLHDRTLSETDEDLQMTTTDFNTAVDLVLAGDLCAGVTSIYNVQTELRNGSVTALYDGRSASQIYGDEFVEGHEGMNSNNFVATQDWYESNPEQVAFFLEIWQRGVEEWDANREEILRAYPDDFGIGQEEGVDIDDQVEYLLTWYEDQFDEFVDSVYLDEEWIRGDAQITDLLKDAGVIPEDQSVPAHACIDPSSGEQTCLIPDEDPLE